MTAGSLGGPNAGNFDVFLRKYDSAGNVLWTRQLGTSAAEGYDDRARVGVSADGMGNVYLSGWTQGNLGGPNAGGRDPFLAKYDAAGTLQWIEQFGIPAADGASGVSADGLGNVYVSGYTECHRFPGMVCAVDGIDAFIAKFRDDAPVLSPGDFNADGTANAADYVVWRNGLGTSYTQADYDVWRAHFGQTAGSLGASAGLPSSVKPAVPEPTSAALTLFAMSLLAFLHRAHHTGLPGWKPVWKPESAIHDTSRHPPARLGGALLDCRRAKHRSMQTSCEGSGSSSASVSGL